LILLDFDPRVRRLEAQPLTVHYENDGLLCHYTPDALAEFDGGNGGHTTVVYEVKYRSDLREKWDEFRPRFVAANRYCRERGWMFRILTEVEIRTPALENATFFRPYRTIPDQPLTRMQLLYTLQALGPTTPQALLAATYESPEAQMPALAILWHLIATRQIPADLNKPLHMRSLINVRMP
jgi:hypothetical protein